MLIRLIPHGQLRKESHANNVGSDSRGSSDIEFLLALKILPQGISYSEQGLQEELVRR